MKIRNRRTFARCIAWVALLTLSAFVFFTAWTTKNPNISAQNVGAIIGIFAATLILNIIGWWVRSSE